MKIDSFQPGLYETDKQEWSLARLQRWINEAEHLLSDMQTGTGMEIPELRARIECELSRKKELLTKIWGQSVPQR